jgi:phage baseplate assembly protein V
MISVEQTLASIARRVLFMVRRGLAALVDDSLPRQTVQVKLLLGEVQTDVDRFQSYGFSSVPLPGADVILLAIGGQGGQLIAIAVDDKTSRPTGGAPGETVQYSKFGQTITCKADGSIELLTKLGARAVLKASGAIELAGAAALPVKGVVTGDCLCAFTGAPHPQTSINVKASL